MNWLKDAVIYHIFLDRFGVESENKSDFLGGNLKNVVENIPYFKELGVNTILLSPHNKSANYHGYHVTDYKRVDPHFGTNEDMSTLIKKLHENEIKIMADYIPTNTSIEHSFFIEALSDRKSKYRDWYHFAPDGNYETYFDIKILPKLNLENPETKDYMIGVANYWLGYGIDGLRIDHANGPSYDFLKELNSKTKEKFPNSALVGEIWSNDNEIKKYTNILDGAFDFPAREIFLGYMQDKTNWDHADYLLKQHYEKYPKDFNLLSFFENHDTNRTMKIASNRNKIKDARKLQFKYPQGKIIYNGAEIGKSQNGYIWTDGNTDLPAREPFNPQKKRNEEEQDMIEFYKWLINEYRINFK